MTIPQDENLSTPSSADSISDPATIPGDIPCAHCGYNLRGLTDNQRCPECGANVERSLAIHEPVVLCLACMKPNPAAQILCQHCRAPLTTAAATAGYFRTTPGASTSSFKRRLMIVIMLWLFLGSFPIAGIMQIVYLLVTQSWPQEPIAILFNIIMLSAAIIVGAILFFATRAVIRYRKIAAAEAEREREIDTADPADNTEPDDDV